MSRHRDELKPLRPPILPHNHGPHPARSDPFRAVARMATLAAAAGANAASAIVELPPPSKPGSFDPGFFCAVRVGKDGTITGGQKRAAGCPAAPVQTGPRS